ncbi:SigE family RNA polymerase sigma factor [Actinoplanes sp. TBRC 11911]|nr:SigE family RNA polymerase sigma factor [Actinoplanes sp. TBRC 11911]
MGSDDDDGFRAFVRQQWDPLTRTAYLLTGDHSYAEDLVQTALEKTHRRWRKVSVMDSPAGYVHRVMVNTAISWRRRRSWGEIALTPPDRARGDDPYAGVEQRQQLVIALRKLPPRMRAVLVLRYFDDLSEADVAEVMGCSVGTVKSQASRGLQRLREEITPTGMSPSVSLQGS